ncbi:MAG: flavin reductase family protein [Kineosporiaceae bacterium]|jgi:flavin reductase (DIM6/NTAB) family NADH-FMN oxidoreductase RutF
MDAQAKRTALRAINYGLHIVTARDGDEYAAAGINWITQASFAPPLVVVGVKADSQTHDLVKRSGAFVVNVLGEDQLDVAKAFFRPTEVADGTLNGHPFTPAPQSGAPVLTDLPYWFEARVTDIVERGDHTVVIGEVVGAGVHDESVTPLVLRSTGMNYGG